MKDAGNDEEIMKKKEVSSVRQGTVYNKGYGDAGASGTKRSLKGFRASSGAPAEDIDFNNMTLRQRSRMLYMAAPVATSAIKTSRTNTIGVGLRLSPSIDREKLGLTPEQAENWEKSVKREFSIWADSADACDALGLNNFYELQQLAFISWLMSGDVFVLRKEYKPEPLHPYGLRLHLVEADRIATPSDASGIYGIHYTEGKTKKGNIIHDGVEINGEGRVVAYHIRNTYPNEMNITETVWKRVEVRGKKSGLPNILHVMNAERPDQYRGISYLAQIVEPILQLRRYTEAEIDAAVVQSFFTAFIETEADSSEMPFNETAPPGEEERYDPNEYRMGPAQINVLNKGEKANFIQPTHPNTTFDSFVKAICTQIGAALEIPRDLLLKEFNKSYSASRAALLEAWKSFRMYRQWFASDFCIPVYEMWMTEAVARGRVNAPGFFTDLAVRRAWLGAKWIGPSQGQLDGTKEMNAAKTALELGLTTHEEESVKYNGSSYLENIERLKEENKKMRKASSLHMEGKQDV